MMMLMTMKPKMIPSMIKEKIMVKKMTVMKKR